MSSIPDQPVVTIAETAPTAEVAALLQLANRKRLQQAEERRRMVSDLLRQASRR